MRRLLGTVALLLLVILLTRMLARERADMGAAT